ncbi:AAA family ATPase [Salinarimonas ramus]|uniref:Kinase n=1 Tax=Salinarimonas ramus TaxID=690164 RepID=A0A917Q501_9HYPH|nr:AAA family ATPase [Salinarimonas ramus]GGK23300.1 kinase [Salinarimonas ramus]
MNAHRPLLVALSDLPGTGKTTLARALAARLGAVFLRIDSIETALARSALRIRPAEDAGYVVAYALAEDNLRGGLPVVADGVNPIALTRDAFAEIARRTGVPLVVIETVCTDAGEHERRIEARRPDLEGQRLPSWEDVLAREWEPLACERLVVDTGTLSEEEALARALAYVRSVAAA